MPDETTRHDWASRHNAQIARLLERANLSSSEQRLYRARFWLDGELLTAAILQRFNAPPNVPRVSVYVVRGHDKFPVHAPKLDLSGKYSIDDIVAFLRLDLLDPAAFDWTDETDSGIVVPVGVVDSLLRSGGL